ncbi:MAG: hypothetical protein RR312_08630 [Bacteroidales bacterium]
MNQAAELVSDSITDEFITLTINGKVITAYPPKICVIAKGLKHFSRIELKEEYTKISIISEMSNNQKPMIEGLVWLIGRNWWDRRRLRDILNKATWSELQSIWVQYYPLIGGEDFFVCALSMKSASNLIAKAK